MDNFIGLSRDIVNHWIYKDAEHFKVWFEMIYRARFVSEPLTDTYQGIIYTVNYGEFIFGYPSWSSRLGIGERRLRTLIRQLISANMIVLQKKHSKFTVYRIVNYEKYNKQNDKQQSYGIADIVGDIDKQNDKQATSTRQPPDNLPTTKEERSKKEKKDIKDIIYAFQQPTLEEVKVYCAERNNKVDPAKWYDFYSSKGWMVGKNKMKDWKAAVRTWEHNEKSQQPASKYRDMTNYRPGE